MSLGPDLNVKHDSITTRRITRGPRKEEEEGEEEEEKERRWRRKK